MSSSESKQAFLVSIQKTQGQRLRRFLSARLRNAAADTPDLMQEVFLRLLRIDDHETIRNPQAYLFTVASHVLHQHALRQTVTAESVALPDLAAELQQAAEGNPADEVETEQLFEALGGSLQKISPRAYMTLVWSRCDGLSLQEIADRFGVSRDQVKKYLARALLHIRQGLQERA
ncbi:RNA polymerase sigma factor [Steroidobacter sp.]|uniref:RNA polymerase sigma factor n=1 Tax=Steroidobacter sp. TaxID=1978227 RepID=UPI001A4908A9|nr:RNA polymerase sigma factor [Steroidobacter sp.]MBL8267042.1 RNA polymerase sigma factor [Steroidobacter sp.]